MFQGLHAAQRLWLMFATVFLVASIVLVVIIWPRPNRGVLADLRSPECQVWREVPAGFSPDNYPATPAGQCAAMAAYIAKYRVALPSEDEYRSQLTSRGMATTLKVMGTWLFFTVIIYLLGWASAWLSRALMALTARSRGAKG